MFSSVIYLTLFSALFFLPGFCLTVILGIKRFRFLLAFALSYSILVLTLLPFEYYAQPIVHWEFCVLLVGVGLALLAVVKTFRHGNLKHSRRPHLIRGLLNPRLIVPLVLAGIICGYLAYVGPYLEIPSDAWFHLRRFQWLKLDVIDPGHFLPGLSFKGFFAMQGPYWYFIHWYFMHAWLCHIAGLAIMDSLCVLSFVNVTVFLLSIYYFGLFIFAGLRISALNKMMMAAIASLFAAVTMGTMVFAYIRYYAFASTILNYALFLVAMAVIIAWLRSNRWLGHALWIAPVLLLVTSTIHTQEALFIFFMTLALGLVKSAIILWRKYFNPAGQPRCGNCWTVGEIKCVFLAAVLLLVFLAGFNAARHFKPGAWVSTNMIMPQVSIPSEPVNFIFSKLLISAPQNPWLRLVVHQLFVFYQVIGCWGLFVYLLFILMLRRFSKIPYLTAGMIMVPLLTAFNPLMVDMIVRMGRENTLYRFHYLTSLPFVGGYLFVHFAGKTREWLNRMSTVPTQGVSSIWPRLAWLKCVGSILVLVGLVGLVFPINAAGIYAPYSKFYTLRKLPAGNDYHLCDDLGKFMARYQNKVILTDHWIDFFLMLYSPKNTYCYTKWLSSSNPANEPPEPYTWENLRKRGLIVINRRDGDLSITGKIAKHWPEDVLPKNSRYYSIEAQTYLESHPELFQKIWSRDRITVYTVR